MKCPYKARGLREIGKGTTRRVYDLGDGRVLKKCLHHHHPERLCPCIHEAEQWASIQDSPHRSLFAPVLEHGPHWCVMPKADDVPFPCTDGCPMEMPFGSQWFRSFANKLYAHNLNVWDVHPGQVGVFGGEMKLIDYVPYVTGM